MDIYAIITLVSLISILIYDFNDLYLHYCVKRKQTQKIKKIEKINKKE